MNFAFSFFGVFAFVVFSTLHANGVEDSMKEVKARKQIEQLADNLNLIYARFGFATRASFSKNMPWKESFDQSTKSNVLSFQDMSGSIQLRESNLDLVGFMNGLAWEAARGASAPKYLIKKPPSWLPDHAAKIAQDTAITFFPNMARQTQVTSCVFSYDGRQEGHYREGYWEIILRRISNDGYPFRSDFINYDISESTGIVAAYMRIPSNYQCGAGVPMSESLAETFAKKGMEEFRKCTVGLALVGNSSVTVDESKGALEIVNPPDVNSKSIREWVLSVSANAKLAWVFNITLTTRSSSSSSLVNAEHIAVFVDAQNGSFLGADF